MASDQERDRARALLRQFPDEVRTVKGAREYVEAIRAIRLDDEVAHAAEDELRAAVLKAIMKGVNEDDAADLCAAALETSNIKFNRWCA